MNEAQERSRIQREKWISKERDRLRREIALKEEMYGYNSESFQEEEDELEEEMMDEYFDDYDTTKTIH